MTKQQKPNNTHEQITEINYKQKMKNITEQ